MENQLKKRAHACRSGRDIRQMWEHLPEWIGEIATAGGELEEPFSDLAEVALNHGESFLALDIAEEATRLLQIRRDRTSTPVQRALSRLGHSRALALARTGSVVAAQQLLTKLYDSDRKDPRIRTALARTFKDLALSDPESDFGRDNLRKAHELYLDAFLDSPEDPFPGINAATTALWNGHADRATALAHEVRDLCLKILEESGASYWNLATLGESYLLVGNTEVACDYYGRARELIDSSREWANLSSTRRQARLICAALRIDKAGIDAVLRFPTFIVFSGHMVDGTGRTRPRFPEERVEEVRAAIRQRIVALNAGFALCSAAAGSDLIFIEEMLEIGGETHVVLPWQKEDFMRSSIDPVQSDYWREKFESLLNRASSVTYLSQQTEPRGSLGYEYCNRCMYGMALQRARELGAELQPLAVWDGRRSGEGPGGTHSFVDFWLRRGAAAGARRLEIVSLPRIERDTPIPEEEILPISFQEIRVTQGQQTVKSLLFADVVGYSKITEPQTECFANEFLGAVSGLISGDCRPVLATTWGDAIYMVFDESVDAGIFALRLRKLINSRPWGDKLPGTLSIRIALHTGPVLLCVDPIVRQMTFTGSHVSHVARIEPVVTAGDIWASEAFVSYATLAGLERPLGFAFDYLGQIDFSKNYGRYPLFRLRAVTLRNSD